MTELPIPLKNVPITDIFLECVHGFRSNEKKKRLLSFQSDIKHSVQEYFLHIPRDIEHFVDHKVAEEDKKFLISVYDDKFSDSAYPKGRRYYDKIMAQANGKCAICGVGVASTLDHYLPKSKYPLLCVFPANLVPECQSCNKNKGSGIVLKNNQMLLHPYFDDLSSNIWLDVRLEFLPELVCHYYCSSSDIDFKKRVEKTMSEYKLYHLYSVEANSEIANGMKFWKMIIKEIGKEKFKTYLEKITDSHEAADRNSWSAALYRAIVRQYSEFLVWLG